MRVAQYNKYTRVLASRFMADPASSIICSVEQQNFKVVPQDGRFDVMCKGLLLFTLFTAKPCFGVKGNLTPKRDLVEKPPRKLSIVTLYSRLYSFPFGYARLKHSRFTNHNFICPSRGLSWTYSKVKPCLWWWGRMVRASQ